MNPIADLVREGVPALMATHYWRGDGGNTLKLLLNSRDLPRQHVDAFTARVRFSVLSDANMQELAASSFFHQRWCVVIIAMPMGECRV